MEFNNNLASLRDMSESQIKVLLKLDSPPETPSQVTHMIMSNEPYNNNKVQNESFSNILLNNREQLSSQMNSQIDFPIFNNDKDHFLSPNAFTSFKFQTREQEDSVLMFSQNTDYITLNSCNQSNILFCNNEDKIESSTCIKNQGPIFGSDKKDNIEDKSNEVDGKSKTKNIDEVDDILKCIDFESIPNLGENHFNINISSTSHRDCRSEIALKYCVLKSNDKIAASCPAYFQDANLLESNIITAHQLTEEETVYNVRSLELTGDNSISKEECSLNKEPTVDFDSVKRDERKFYNENNKDKDELSFQNDGQRTENNASLIPFSVKQLYDIVKADNSDFAFIYALSAQLCQDRVPMECFVTLKIALLLSLASIGNDPDRPPLSVVAIANDTYMTDYLMINIGKLATRFVGPIVEIKSTTYFNNWTEADPMLLSRGGVYYAGDWNRLKLKRAECIFKSIECSNVPVEKSNLSYPLESAIWTHWRSYKYNSKDQQTFNKFLKIFGIPVFVSDDSHETLVEYTLEQSSVRIFESTVDHLSINEDDMRKFLVYVSQIKVNLTPEAETLLKNYFVVSRSFRQDCLTKQSYITLKQFAESFCKLSMRSEVSTDDALAAIILCEHSIENVFSFGCDPSPHFGSFPFIGAVDEYLTDFKKWLESYLNKISKN